MVLPVYESLRVLKNLNIQLNQLKMKEDKFVTHEELGVERRLSSLEGSYVQHQRYFTAISVMILAAMIGIFSLLFALMNEISEVKAEVSRLKVAISELKEDVGELKHDVSELKRCLRSIR